MGKGEVFIVRSTRPDTDSRLLKSVEMLMLLGFNVTILAWDRNNNCQLDNHLIVNGASARLCLFREEAPHGRGLKNIFGLIRFEKWIYKTLNSYAKSAYAIHSCDLDTGIPCKRFCEKKKIKMVYDVYDFYAFSRNIPKPIDRIVEKIEYSVIDSSRCTIICSEERKKQIEKAKNKNIQVIYNSPKIDQCVYPPRKYCLGERIKICYVGVLSYSRLLREIIDELPNHPRYELHIGGIGPLSEYIESKVESENLFYYGSLKYSDVLDLERNCDLLFATYDPCIKGHKMSAPNKIYEAMALGKPIIVCKNTSIDLLVDNSFGFACDYDAKDFFYQCDRIMNDEDLYLSFSERAASMYPDYSFERNLDVMKKIYEEL